MKLKLLGIICVLLFLLTGISFGSVTGKITGVITDAANQQPLVGVTVAVQGTNWGAITDADGRYNILNIPVGTYTLMISAVGYANVEVTNVEVHAGLATYQNQALTSEVTKLGTTISVKAESPLVIKDKTSTINIVQKSAIQALPTRGFEQIVGIQNGVVRINSNPTVRPRGGREAINTAELDVRGGRPSEVAYYVDGFSQQDPLSGTSTANIANNAIKEVQVIAGGFSAEYGNVASGIVQVTTSSGGKTYHGSLESVTDNFASGVKHTYDNNWYSADFGGPIPNLENGHFFGSVERRYMGDRKPSSITEKDFGNGHVRLPSNTLSGWSYQGKIDYNFTPNTKLLLSTNGSVDKWREYQHNYFFDFNHMPYYDDQNFGINAKLTQTINKTTYFNLSSSYYMTKRFRGDGVYKEDLYAYGRPNGNPRFDNTSLFWSYNLDSSAVEYGTRMTDGVERTYVTGGDEGHVWDDYYKRKSSYIAFKGDLTSQINEYHTIKTGFEFQRHTLRYYRDLFPVESYKGLDSGGFIDVDRYGYDFQGNESDNESWQNSTKHPINWAAFLQDRLEWRGMIVTAGLRFDYYDYRARRLRNTDLPLDPDSLQFKSPGSPGTTTLEESDLEPSKKFTRLSPRLGIAFPVSDKTQMHLNYGKFYQRPDLIRLYVGYNFYEKMINRGGFFYPFGNPNIEPEKTTQYEVGVSHRLGDNTVFNATAFYKDVTGLVQVYTQQSLPKSFSTYRNSDYGTIKGMEFQLAMRRTKNIELNAKYTLSFANGTGSYANTQSNIAWTNARSPKETAPLTYDQRHNIVATVDIRSAKGEGPKIGNYYPLENTGVNFLITAASGTPYSPQEIYNEVTLAAISPIPSGPRNSEYGPWTFRIDMKIERTFDIRNYKITSYFWVKNLLDRDNVYSVYESTGDPNNTGWLETDAGKTFVAGSSEPDDTGYNGEQKYKIKENNPQNYGIPRMIMFGLRLSF